MKAIVISGSNLNGGTIYYTLSEQWQFSISAMLIISRVQDILSKNKNSSIRISIISK